MSCLGLPRELACGACGQTVHLANEHPGFGEPGYRHPGGAKCDGSRRPELPEQSFPARVVHPSTGPRR